MNPNVTDDDLNRTLAASGEIVPSSGFVASVMEAVQQEATVPAPIPFPWKWAIPGLVASVGLVVYFLIRLAHAGMRTGYDAASGFSMAYFSLILPRGLASASITLAIEWALLALLLSFLAVRLSLRIERE